MAKYTAKGVIRYPKTRLRLVGSSLNSERIKKELQLKMPPSAPN
jgi:hypothetical protein